MTQVFINESLAQGQSVPSVAGGTESEARKTLKDRGFTGKITSYKSSSAVQCPPATACYIPGLVCASKPDYNDGNIPPDSEISLLIQAAESTDECAVPPNVIGMSVDEALKALAVERFTDISGFRIVQDEGCQASKVCGVFLSGGKWNAQGKWEGSTTIPPRRSRVYLDIGTAYPYTAPKSREVMDKYIPMINIVGDTLSEALAKLDKLGTRGSINFHENYPCPAETKDLGAGRICHQDPSEGKPLRVAVQGMLYRLAKDKDTLPTTSADDSPFAKDGDSKPSPGNKKPEKP